MSKKSAGRNMRPFYMFFNTEGMNQRSGPMVAVPTSAELVQNMHVDLLGSFSAYRQGYDVLTEQLEGGSRIDGLHWYTTEGGTHYLMAAVGGKVKTINPDTGAVDAEISTALTAGNRPDFETFRGYAYMAEPSLANPLKWNGAGNMTAIALFPKVVGGDSFQKPKYCEKYANRMVWGPFENFGSHLMITDDLAPETCTIGMNDTDGLILKVAPGDGQNIKGYRRFSVLNDTGATELLLVFKERSAYIFTGNTPGTFDLNILSDEVGAVNNDSIVVVGNDVIWLGEDGIFSLSAATQAPGLRPNAIGSKDVKDTLATINIDQLDKCWAVHHKERQEIWFAFPTGANTECDTIVVYHYPTDDKEAAAWSVRKNTTQTCGIYFKKDFISGDDQGYLNQWFGSSQYGNTGINWIYRNHYFNFSSQMQDKQVLELFAWFLMYGPESMSFRYTWRGGGNNTSKTINKTVTLDSGESSIFGTVAPPAAVLGESVFGSGAVLKKVKIPVLGNGEQLQLEVSGNTGNTGPIFLGYSGWVEYLGPARSYR